jgi:hypothetical protein
MLGFCQNPAREENGMRRALIVLCAAMCGLPAMAQQVTSPPQHFDLPEDQPPLGSHIKREAVSGSLVPYDKTYEELTPEQKASLKSQYEAMGPDDDPPYPSRGLLPIVRALSIAQRKLLVEGDLMLAVDVDPSGTPVSVSIYQSPDEEMARVAAQILMLQHYRPARCAGKPCRQQFPFRTSFKVSSSL